MGKLDRSDLVKRRIRSAVENSLLRSVFDRLSKAYERSTLSRFGVRVVEIARKSEIYQWLTADPDPQMVVIDLRETYTVGPLLSILDRLVPRVEKAWRRSGFASAVAGIKRMFAESKAIQVVSAVLSPPKSPETDRQSRK
ncbi:hypothetical protein ACOZ4I_02300 [Haloarcula salina]|uniref:hypothetical protein n=1 Tax=Haloarcula salina TaxID=1429914 RepID=UPI003C701FB6